MQKSIFSILALVVTGASINLLLTEKDKRVYAGFMSVAGAALSLYFFKYL